MALPVNTMQYQMSSLEQTTIHIFASLEFQSLEGIIKSIGIDPCKLCTYCWNGKE